MPIRKTEPGSCKEMVMVGMWVLLVETLGVDRLGTRYADPKVHY